jgi:hypothetical protein
MLATLDCPERCLCFNLIAFVTATSTAAADTTVLHSNAVM